MSHPFGRGPATCLMMMLCAALLLPHLAVAQDQANRPSAALVPQALQRTNAYVTVDNSRSEGAALGSVDYDLSEWPRVTATIYNTHSYWMKVSRFDHSPSVRIVERNIWAEFGYIPGSSVGGIRPEARGAAVYTIEFDESQNSSIGFFVNAGNTPDGTAPAGLLTLVQIVAQMLTGEDMTASLGLLTPFEWDRILTIASSIDACVDAATATNVATLTFNLLRCLGDDRNLELLEPAIKMIASKKGIEVDLALLKKAFTVKTIVELGVIFWDQALSLAAGALPFLSGFYGSFAGSIRFNAYVSQPPAQSPPTPRPSPTPAPSSTSTPTPPPIGAPPARPTLAPGTTSSISGLTYVSPEGDLMLVGEDGVASRLAEGSIRDPSWSHDGSRIAYVRYVEATGTGIAGDQIEVANADGSNARIVVPPRTNPYAESRGEEGHWGITSVRWAPDDSALYYFRGFALRGGKQIMRVELAIGEENELTITDVLPGPFDIAPDGTLVMLGNPTSADAMTYHVYLRHQGGASEVVLSLPYEGSYSSPAWSPDGSQLAVWVDGDIVLVGRDGREARRFAVISEDTVDDVAWSHDGETLAYVTTTYGEEPSTIRTVPVAGGSATQLFDGNDPAWRPASAAATAPTPATGSPIEPGPADPASTSLVRIQNMACPGTNEVSFHISPLPFAIDPGPDCTAPTTTVTISDAAENATSHEIAGFTKVDLPTGSYTITDDSTDATASFDLPMEDSRDKRPPECDGRASCVSILISMPPPLSGGQQGEPTATAPLRISVGACRTGYSRTEFGLMPVGAMPEVPCPTASDYAFALIAGDGHETLVTPEDGPILELPVGSYTIVDNISGATFAFELTSAGLHLNIGLASSRATASVIGDPASTSYVQLLAMSCPGTQEPSIGVIEMPLANDWGITCFPATANVSITDAEGNVTYHTPYGELSDLSLPAGMYTAADLDNGLSTTFELPLPDTGAILPDQCDGRASCALIVISKPLLSESVQPDKPVLRIQLNVNGTPPSGTAFALYLYAPDIGLLVCEALTDPDGDGVYLSGDLAVPSWPAGTEGFVFPGGRIVEGIGYTGGDTSGTVSTTCFAEERRTIQEFELQDVTEDTTLTASVSFDEPTTTAIATVPDAYLGTWEGIGIETNPPVDWPVTVTLSGGGPGSVVGTTEYPDNGCGGDLILQEIAADAIVLVEALTYGEDACADGGTITLGLMLDGTMSFAWEGVGSAGPSTASGALHYVGGGQGSSSGTTVGTVPTAPGDAPWVGTSQLHTFFIGTWQGTGTQTNPVTDWPVTVSFTGGRPGEVIGTIDYSSLSCGGELTLTYIDPLDPFLTIEVAERITYGQDNCIDGGVFMFSGVESGNRLRFRWTSPDGATTAEGYLDLVASGAPVAPVSDGVVVPASDSSEIISEQPSGDEVAPPVISGDSVEEEPVPIEPESGG